LIQNINERRELKKKVLETKEKYYELAEFLPDIIYEADLNLNLIYLNSSGHEKFGYSLRDIEKGLNCIDLISKECRMLVKENINRIIQGKRTEPIEIILIKNDGSKFYGRVHSRPILKENKVVAIGGIIYDISRRKESEKNLKDSEEKFRVITEQSAMGICILQDDLNKYFNQKFIELFGFSKKEVENWKPKEYFSLIHPEYRDLFVDQAEKKQHGEKDVIDRYSIRAITKSKDVLWLELYFKTINYRGAPADLVTFINVTENKKTEKKLKESEQRFKDLVDLLPVIVCEVEQNYNLTYVNSIAFKKLGYSQQDLKKGLNIKQVVANEHLEKALKNLDLLFKGKSVNPQILKLQKKNGTKVYFRISSQHIIKNNSISGVRFVLNDMTEIILAEKLIRKENKKLLHLNKELNSLDEMRKAFLDIASHELKTPLSSIYGATQLFSQFNKKSLDKNSLELLEIIEHGCLKLKYIILNILDVSRIESKKFTLQLEKIDIVEILRKCIIDTKYLQINRRHQITTNLPEKYYITADPTKIERIFINLLSNAIKYSPKESTTHISLTKIPDKKMIEISVKDNGIGLTKEELGRLFVKYNRLERNKTQMDLGLEGTGLGLHISKRFVEIHKGQITAKSAGRNKGSTFFVRLPTDL
ncbi:MAG: PAS domain S-box protein, partial [Candidatus Lokiarchaeota archaeon]|nr:PAS domain S-box protein [Candidatus Lokiarchaeota archaeon]MBD3342537.1 PAS domain S-box protein [Candidatus Lokiarchaeota archaeon]